MEIKDIMKRMRGGEPIPVQEIDQMLVRLAGEYSYYASLYESVIISKASKWIAIRIRDDIKSDTQAEREWDMTDDGKNEIGYKLRMKAIEKMMTALRAMGETARRELNQTKYT